MRNLHITLAHAITGIANVVSERGAAHVAVTSGGGTGCVYAEKDNSGALLPVCIVGEFFARLGFLGALVTVDNDGYGEFDLLAACIPSGEFWTRLDEYGITADAEAQDFLRAAQASQDAGEDWGTALVRAWTGLDKDQRNNLDYPIGASVIRALEGHKVDAMLLV